MRDRARKRCQEDLWNCDAGPREDVDAGEEMLIPRTANATGFDVRCGEDGVE